MKKKRSGQYFVSNQSSWSLSITSNFNTDLTANNFKTTYSPPRLFHAKSSEFDIIDSEYLKMLRTLIAIPSKDAKKRKTIKPKLHYFL